MAAEKALFLIRCAGFTSAYLLFVSTGEHLRGWPQVYDHLGASVAAGGLWGLVQSRNLARGLKLGAVLGFVSGPAFWYLHIYKKLPTFYQTALLEAPGSRREGGGGSGEGSVSSGSSSSSSSTELR